MKAGDVIVAFAGKALRLPDDPTQRNERRTAESEHWNTLLRRDAPEGARFITKKDWFNFVSGESLNQLQQ